MAGAIDILLRRESMRWAKWMIVSWAAVLFLTPVSLAAKTIFVDANVTGLNDGSSWANAYQCLQDALVDASTATKPVEIRVARGVYRPDQGRGITPGDRDEGFRLVGGITLKGGYAGIGAANPELRDAAKCPSILSGDLNGDDAPVQNPSQLLSDPKRADNSHHVVLVAAGDAEDIGTVIDGFTIVAGQDDVKALDLASKGGAGILVLSGTLTLADCIVRENGTCNVGGGMYTTAGCQPTLRNCSFTHNYAQYGGGLGSGRLYVR
jgi:hypothetical protein